MTPDEMVRALDSRFDVLKGPGTTHAPHHAHLLTMIDWSYRLLSDEDRRRFRALGAFPHTFTREAAATVTESDPLELLDTLDTLVSHHLVRAMDRTGPAARFGLLETIHEFVVAKLTEHGEGDACRAALAEWCTQLAIREEALLGTPDGGAAIARLDAELDNLRAAMAWSVGPGADAMRAEYGLRIAGTLWRYWPRRGLVTEATQALTTGLALGPEPSLVTADALLALGAMAMDHGDLPQAIEWFERCADQYEQFADDERVATLWVGLATCYRETTRLDEAEALFGKALAAHVAAGRVGGQGVALNGLAATSYRRGDFQQAVAYWQRALDIARERGQQEVQVHLSSNIGLGLVALDDYDRAFEAYSQGIAIAESLGDPQLLLICCANRAEVETTRGNFAAARADLDRVAELADPSDMRMQVIVPTNRGVLARGEGRLGDALALLHSGLTAALAGGRQMEAVQIVEAATIVAAELGEAEPVSRWLAHARAYRESTGTEITDRVAAELAEAAELVAARRLAVAPDAVPSADAILSELGALATAHAGAQRAVVNAPDPLCELGLSAREAEVARLLVARLTDQEIADRLHIGIRTVATHVSAVRRKLDVPGRRGVAARLAELGFELREPD
jgi:DNA-binding CsgD family transcriptional regulator/tetratricopeptide (TPR) repeat protein